MSLDMELYRGADGFIDWAALHAAEVAAGQRCRKCGRYTFPGSGHPRECGACQALYTVKSEVSSESFVRCPQCRATWNPFDNGFAPDAGETQVQCRDCDHTFAVRVDVTYTFSSPPLDPDPPEDEPEPDPEEDA